MDLRDGGDADLGATQMRLKTLSASFAEAPSSA
jgi:hypothetical protein